MRRLVAGRLERLARRASGGARRGKKTSSELAVDRVLAGAGLQDHARDGGLALAGRAVARVGGEVLAACRRRAPRPPARPRRPARAVAVAVLGVRRVAGRTGRPRSGRSLSRTRSGSRCAPGTTSGLSPVVALALALRAGPRTLGAASPRRRRSAAAGARPQRQRLGVGACVSGIGSSASAAGARPRRRAPRRRAASSAAGSSAAAAGASLRRRLPRPRRAGLLAAGSSASAAGRLARRAPRPRRPALLGGRLGGSALCSGSATSPGCSSGVSSSCGVCGSSVIESRSPSVRASERRADGPARRRP